MSIHMEGSKFGETLWIHEGNTLLLMNLMCMQCRLSTESDT